MHQTKKLLRVNNISFQGSVSDGPGIRTVLYLQGCQRGCFGCHNRSTWDKDGGYKYDITELANIIRASSQTNRLTISGGEPLDQFAGVFELVQLLADFDLALYTGNEIEQVPIDLIKFLSWIKVGAYDHSKRITIFPFIGSSNQQFLSSQDITKILNSGGVA
jgi:anaerobic ribonucleoside-triphosphate reductase activating protein